MKTFINWAEDQQLLDEKTKRDILYTAYPAAYYSGLYPPEYKSPANADLLFKLGPNVDAANDQLGKFDYKNFKKTSA